MESALTCGRRFDPCPGLDMHDDDTVIGTMGGITIVACPDVPPWAWVLVPPTGVGSPVVGTTEPDV